jgi:ribosomal protein S18 acetylase RimI-like enzyme
MAISVTIGTERDVEYLASLWMSLVEHHRRLVGDRWPVRPAEQAWDLRQAQYRRWLSDRTGLLFVARDGDLASPVGYAFCLLSGPGPTFDFGETRAEVDSLVVADTARGAGIGTLLLDACRAELRRRGIRYWSIGVIDANERAVALYERLGFRPYVRSLMGTTD